MPSKYLGRGRMVRSACTSLLVVLGASPALGEAAFNYAPIGDPIINATFSVEFAGLTAHRFVGAVEVNKAALLDPTATFPQADLSADLFGADVWPAPASLDQGDFDTGTVSATIPPSFFTVLSTGEVGLSSLFTDTNDAAFAIDTIFITIETASDVIVAEYGSPNNGFGIGLPDGDVLPAPLPDSIPVGATGTGFDETITSKSIYVVPEPAALAILVVGGLIAFRRRRGSAPRPRLSTLTFGLLGVGMIAASAMAGGEPDQLHVSGPIPNELVVGTEGELIVTVESQFVGVPGVSLVYTNLMGDFTFLGGVIPGPGGDVANDTTNANGQSFMTIQADAEGPALIEIGIPGSPLSPVYSLFFIVSDCIPDCEEAECGPDGCGGECGTCPPNWICFEGTCFPPGVAGPADFDVDGDVDLRDFALLARCFDPSTETPAQSCSIADVSGDNQVDLSDFVEMEEAMTGPQ